MNQLIILTAKYGIIISVIIALILFLRLRERKQKLEYVIVLIVGGLLSLALAKLGSHLIQDPRPFVVGHFTPLIPHAVDNGFPSDHTLLASFIAWSGLYYSRKLSVIAFVIAILVGLSRILAGVHHLEDIIGSFVISGIATIIVIVGIYLFHTRIRAKKTLTE